MINGYPRSHVSLFLWMEIVGAHCPRSGWLRVFRPWTRLHLLCPVKWKVISNLLPSSFATRAGVNIWPPCRPRVEGDSSHCCQLRNLRSATPSLLPSFIFLPSSHRGRDPRGDNCRILGRVEVFAPLSPTRARIASKGEDRRGQQGFRSVVDCGDCSPPPPIRLATALSPRGYPSTTDIPPNSIVDAGRIGV